MKRTSLKLQLTLLIAVLTIGFSLVLLFFLSSVSGSVLRSEIQQDMIRIVERDIDEAEYVNGVFTPENDFIYYKDNVFVVLCATDGTVLNGSLPDGFTPPGSFEDGTLRTTESGSSFFVYDTVIEYKKYEYTIDAATGEVLLSGADKPDGIVPFEGDLSAQNGSPLTAADAYEIALAGESIREDEATLLSVEYDDTTGKGVYKIEYYSDTENYDRIWARGIASTEGDGDATIVITLASIIMPLLIVLVCVAGYLLTGRALRPLGKVVKAAEHMQGGENLSARIHLQKGPREFLRLSEAFDAMAERLQKSFDRERRFTSDVSHELRTPVTVALAECSYALDENADMEDMRESLTVIRRQTERMKGMITRLLEFARMEQGSTVLTKENADLSELVAVVCEDMALLPNDLGITIRSTIAPAVMLDMDIALMTRLLDNLLLNAVRYGRENGHVLVTLQREEGHIVLSVADDGIGIRPEDTEGIWQRFYRADDARERDGSGLGLPLVKRIAEMHGGSVAVESEYGKGSTFTVKF